MRYVYFQDSHYKLRNSINRIGSYEEDWLRKFDELLSIAKEKDVDGIIDGGDLLHSPEPSYKVLDQIADRIEKTKITMHSLLGNHSQRYGSVKTSKYAGLTHLINRCEYLKYFDQLSYHGNQFKTFHIKGFDYYYGIEEDIKKNGLLFNNASDDCWKIAIVHAFVCPKEFPYASHVKCSDIKTEADLCLVAHYHSVWNETVNGTEFVDIGCFGRNTINEAKIDPACILIDTEKRSYEVIKLKSAKKGKEIFDLDKIEEIKTKENKLDLFLEELQNTSFKSIQLRDRINELAKTNNIEENILKNINSRMEDV